MQANGLSAIETTSESEDEWVTHVNAVAQTDVVRTASPCSSWGYLSASIKGEPRIFMPYVGGVGVYRQKCDEVAAAGYEGFVVA